MGMAFWPGGTVEDWGIISETVANQTAPLNPCTTDDNWNNTGLSSQAYLVCFIALEKQHRDSILYHRESRLIAIITNIAMSIVFVGKPRSCFCSIRAENR